MTNKKPDHIVFSEHDGYNAKNLSYPTNLSAPVIKTEDVVGWKTRGIHQVNKELQNKFDELKENFNKLLEEFQWNDLVYNAKFSFEPVIGSVYHLYLGTDGYYFLSLIGPNEWKKEHVATLKLNSDKKWIKLDNYTMVSNFP